MDSTINLMVYRMEAERCSVSISKELVPEEQQRLIFRGRVLKNGKTLQSYGIEDGSVIHLVERPEDAPSAPEAPTAAAATTMTAGSDAASAQTTAGGSRNGNSRMNGNIYVHSTPLDISPDTNPAMLAAQLAQNIAGAISNVFTATHAGDQPAPIPTATTTLPPTANGSVPDTLRAPRPPLFHQIAMRPISRAMPSRPAEVAATGHYIVRIEVERALHNLNQDLQRISSFSTGGPIFANAPMPHPQDYPNVDNRTETFLRTLESFEYIYAMMSSACQGLRQSFACRQVAWDRVHNFTGLLQDLPPLMAVQRRLMMSLRARPSGGETPWADLELPSTLDVPAFLDRPTSNIQIDPPE